MNEKSGELKKRDGNFINNVPTSDNRPPIKVGSLASGCGDNYIGGVMGTKILKQRDLENKGMRVAMKLVREQEQLARCELSMNKAVARFNKQKDKAWKISERLAGIKGLISSCVDGKVEVVGI